MMKIHYQKEVLFIAACDKKTLCEKFHRIYRQKQQRERDEKCRVLFIRQMTFDIYYQLTNDVYDGGALLLK